MVAFTSDGSTPLTGAVVGNALSRDNTTYFQTDRYDDEIYHAFVAQTYMLNTVQEVPQDKITGATYRQPTVGALGVKNRVAGVPVTLQAYSEGELTMVFKRRQECSFAIEDLAKFFLEYDLRSEYISETAIAAARDIDHWILGYRAYWQRNGRYVTAVDSLGSPSPLNQAAILAAILKMDLDLVPADERVFIFSPSQRTSLLTIDGFINGDYVSGAPTMTGEIGSLYGIPVVINNNLLKNSANGLVLITGISGTNRVTTAYPTPGAYSGGVYSPYWPCSTNNGDLNGAGQETLVLADSLPIGYYTGMLVRKGYLKFGWVQRPTTETGREITLASDIVVTSWMYDAKHYRDTNCVLIHSYETV